MLVSSMRLVRLSLFLGLALGMSACSTIADLDPTGLLSDESTPAQQSQFPDQGDQAAPTASDQSQGTTPDLANIPARPQAPTADAATQTAQSLASDGAQARYSADALRGGTEPAAPPPTASDVAPTAAQRLLGTAPQTATAAATATDAPPTAEPAPAAAPAPTPAPASAPTRPQPQMAATPPQLPDGAQPAVPATAPVPAQTAAATANAATPVGPSTGSPATARVSRGEPAVPPTAGRATSLAQPQLSDAALGFRPSAAPPLDPSVAEFAPAPIVQRYRQTASNATVAVASPGAAAVPAVPASRTADSGANAGALSGATAAIAAMNGGIAPAAVIYFPGDGTSLSAAAKAQVRSAVQAFKNSGGQGTVRVVGHASSRTPNMPVEKHLETIFDKSQARANAVAQELIKEGVPASKVLIEAVGDSQPIYYESMPEGEDGNRRAEIFVQG